jgi:hypothetical protein
VRLLLTLTLSPSWLCLNAEAKQGSYAAYHLFVPFKSEYTTDIECEKIIPPPLKLMTKSEVMNDLLKLLSLVQKHADKEGCQHCLGLLESVFWALKIKTFG